VVKGEIIQMRRDLTAAEKRPVPAPPRHHPLVDTAAPVLAVAGAGLLAKITRAASQLVGRWLSQPSSETQIPQPERRQQPEGNRGNGRRLRVRHRRRGR
jgi:hypothetical protein